MLYLNVPFAEKDQAKQLGARWDPILKKWYIPDPAAVDLSLFQAWLSDADSKPKLQAQALAQPQPEFRFEEHTLDVAPDYYSTQKNQALDIPISQAKGVFLTDLLRQIQQTIQQTFNAPIWVKAEIASMNERRGHVYLDLSENDLQGQSLASCRAMIWASKAPSLLKQFEKMTGSPLKEGQKVLLQTKVSFHEKFGLSLVVEDIDPSFTLGELEANLIAIRNRLIKEGFYQLNKKLESPSDLFNIAVIAPPKAAGLGDFKAEADWLTHLNLCQFSYFHSAFQGEQVLVEMLAAFESFKTAHSQQPFDLLVVIRGGGARLDLNPLNQYRLAYSLAHSPIPVFTGIGHERDNTILDEVANQRFDTPSKVAHGIWQIISQTARQAKEHWNQIEKRSQFLLAEKRSQLQSTKQQIDHGQQRSFEFWKNRLDPIFNQIQHKSVERASIEAGRLDSLMNLILHQATRPLDLNRQKINDNWLTIQKQAKFTIETQRLQLKQNIGFILSSGPQSQLKRGFTIAKTSKGVVIANAQQAQQQTKFELEFYDGKVEVQPVNK